MRKQKIMAVAVASTVIGISAAIAQDAKPTYSWQQPHAKVLPSGDLEWAPTAFEFTAGPSVRYIDFVAGDDVNDGATKDSPWKHHPWDANAAGQAKAASGVQTYVFKQGVNYRGTLVADDSGEPGNPIRLTRDPSWGEGEATIAGSRPITGGWKQADAQTAAGFPEPTKVWYQDLPEGVTPRAVWEVQNGQTERIPLARHPNWTMSNPDDVKSEWPTWKNSRKEESTNAAGEKQVRVWADDADFLTDPDPDAFKGGTIWTEYVSVMGQPYPAPIEAYDPAKHAIKVGGPWGDAGAYGPIWMNRYYLENLPRFLDSAGEYYFALEGPNKGRLYVRLPGDRDPNTAAIEVADRTTQIDLRGRSHISVSGLSFKFGNVVTWYDRWWSMLDVDPAGVKIAGNSSNIVVSHCRFDHVPLAVWGWAQDGAVFEGITVSDNDISNADYASILFAGGGGRESPEGTMRDIRILRNRMTETGMRPRRAGQGQNLEVNFPETAEIAGNIIHRTGGVGLWVQGSKQGGATYDALLGRVLIHHNKVTDTLLWTNDYGGIETWQGGSFYVYNNISGNPGGFWNFGYMGSKDKPKDDIGHASARFGFAFYFDGSFKNYVFNNIAWGKSNELGSPLAASTAFHEVIGYLNTFANNTAYRFVAPFRRQAPQGGRGTYIGNVISDTTEVFFRHADVEKPKDVNLETATRDPNSSADTLAYANNVFYGNPRFFGYFQRETVFRTLETFRQALADIGAVASETGVMAEAQPLAAPDQGDFRPSADSAAKDRGVKHFVPWALSRTVGEWGFRRLPADPSRVLSENWYMTAGYTDRELYRNQPRNDLKGTNLTAESYLKGPLEDWTAGSLKLNGTDQFLSLANADGDPEQTLDPGEGNFLVEAYFRTEPGHTGGVLASKTTGGAGGPGYSLQIDDEGSAILAFGGSRTGYASPVNDGQWHHVVFEVDRGTAGEVAVSVYLDGQGPGTNTGPASGRSGSAPDAPFVVGQSFAGEIEFLRVAKGTLADSKTTIGELRAWQFDGPFLRDFAGNAPVGQRDAGALELVE